MQTTGNCAKCNKSEYIVRPPEPTESEAAKLDAELQRELKLLPERKRRTFLRYLRQQEEKATGKTKKKRASSAENETTEAKEEEEEVEEQEPVERPTLAQVRSEAKDKLKLLIEKFSLEEDFDDLDLDNDNDEDEQ